MELKRNKFEKSNFGKEKTSIKVNTMQMQLAWLWYNHIFTPPCPPSFITRELQYPPKIRFLNHPRPFNATNRGNEQSRPAIRGEYNYTHSLRADCNPAGNQTRLPYRRTINSTTAQCDTCPLSRFVKSPRLI